MATIINQIKHTVKKGTNKVKAVFNPVTKEDINRHNYILEKLENEQKLLADRLQRNVYKDHVNLMIAQKAQNRSFHRIRDELAIWDASLKRPKEKLIEEERFREKAIKIQKQYENIVDDYAKEKGICTFLEDKDNCKTGLNCYWFDKEDVAGKDIGCYSRAEAPRDWSVQRRLGRRRKKPTSLDTIEELVGGRKKTRKKRKKRKKKTRKKRGGGTVKCPKVGTENANRDSLSPNTWYDFKAVRKGVIDARNADADNPPIIIELARTLTEEEKKKCRRGYFVNTQVKYSKDGR